MSSTESPQRLSLHVGDELELVTRAERSDPADDVIRTDRFTTQPSRSFSRENPLAEPRAWSRTYALQKLTSSLALTHQGVFRGYAVFGMPGTGKTTFILRLLEDALNKAPNLGGFVIDPKQDYGKLKAAHAGGTRRLVLLSPEASRSVRANVLDAPIPARDRGKLLALACGTVSNPSERYWLDNLAIVLGSVVEALEILDGHAPTLREVVHAAAGARKEDGNAAVKDLAARIEAAVKLDSKHTLENVRRLEIHLAHLKRYADDPKGYVMANILAQAFGEFVFPELSHLSADLRETPSLYRQAVAGQAVVLVQPGRVGGPSGSALMALTRLIFQHVVLAQGIPEDKAERDRLRTFLVVDEFHTVAYDRTELGAGDNWFLSQARAFGCLTIFATQNVYQLEHSLLGDRWEAFLANLACKFFLRAGDPDTASYASKLAGSIQQIEETTSVTAQAESSSQTTTKQKKIEDRLPANVVMSQLADGQGVAIGSLDGRSAPSVRFFGIFEH